MTLARTYRCMRLLGISAKHSKRARRNIHASPFTADIPAVNVADYIQKDFAKYARRTAVVSTLMELYWTSPLGVVVGLLSI